LRRFCNGKDLQSRPPCPAWILDDRTATVPLMVSGQNAVVVSPQKFPPWPASAACGKGHLRWCWFFSRDRRQVVHRSQANRPPSVPLPPIRLHWARKLWLFASTAVMDQVAETWARIPVVRSS